MFEEEINRPYMRMFAVLMKYGIDLFDNDGTVNGFGLETLELLLEHFQRKNSPGRCVYIKSIMAEYKKRWPYRQANYSIN